MVITDPSTIGHGPMSVSLRQAFKEQLPDLNFEFSNKGLTVIVNGINYVTTRLELNLNLKQTEYFLKPEIFEMVYKNPNSFPR